MGKASKKKNEFRHSNGSSGVSSRGSSQGQIDEAVSRASTLKTHPSTVAAPSASSSPTSSKTPRRRSPNWGGRRANQTGRPKLYDSDDERLAAAAARRRNARATAKNPVAKQSGRPQKEGPKNSWGGARSGAGRPLHYTTGEERRARDSELSQQSSARRKARTEADRLIELRSENWQRFSSKAADENPSRKLT